MKAQAMTAFGAPLAPMDLELAKAGPGEAIVRVSRAGLCHSDLHIHDGYFDFGDVQAARRDQHAGGARPRDRRRGRRTRRRRQRPGAGHACRGLSLARLQCVRDLRAPAISRCASRCRAARSASRNGAAWPNTCTCRSPTRSFPIGDLAPGLGALAMCSGLTAYSALKKIGAPPPTIPYSSSAWAASA